MADVTIAHPGQFNGAGDLLAGFLKVFAGETITAFQRFSVTDGRFITRSISSGKSAQFPVFGRTVAKYLTPGKSLDDLRTNMQHNERVIVIDGLLTADCLISDLDEAMNHVDVSSEYSRQLGEALALAYDCSVLAEIAKEAINATPNVTGLGTGGEVTRVIPFASTDTVGINETTAKLIYAIALEVKSKMTKNYVPQSERYAFLNPDMHSALATSLQFLNRDFGATGTILEGNVVRLAGFDFIECPHLTTGGSDNANVYQGSGHVFPAAYASKNPILFCHRTSVGTLKLKDLALEKARRPEYQADQMIAKMAVGHGGLRPEATFIGTITKALS